MRKILYILSFGIFVNINAQVGINTDKTSYTYKDGEKRESTLTVNGELRVSDLSEYSKDDFPLVYNDEYGTLALGNPPMHRVDYLIDMSPNLDVDGNDGQWNPLRLISLDTQIPGDKYQVYIASAVPVVKNNKGELEAAVMTLNGQDLLNGVPGCSAKINDDGHWHIYADWFLQWDSFLESPRTTRYQKDLKYSIEHDYCTNHGHSADYQPNYRADMRLGYYDGVSKPSAFWKITAYVFEKNYMKDLGQYKNSLSGSYGTDAYYHYYDKDDNEHDIMQPECPKSSTQGGCLNLCAEDDYRLNGGRIRVFNQYDLFFPYGDVIPGPKGLPAIEDKYTKNPDGHYYYRSNTESLDQAHKGSQPFDYSYKK